MKKDNILITGGAGFIGSHLVDKLVEKYNITVIDNLSTGLLDWVNPNVNLIIDDVNFLENLEDFFKNLKFKFVFHYAAIVGVKRTLENPISVLNDIEGIKKILNLSIKYGVKRIFYSSSSEVYGEPLIIPQNENTCPLNAKLPYAVIKNLGEVFLKSYNYQYGLEYTIFRFFNTFGPRQSNDFVITKFIKSALKNENITIYGNGEQTRTFNYIDNNIITTTNALEIDNSINQIMNIGADEEINMNELAKKIIGMTNSKSKIVYVDPLKEGDMKVRKPDITKMKNILLNDVNKLIDFNEGLKRTIKFYDNI